MSDRRQGSYDMSSKKQEKNSSLSQTKARYQQIIQNLTSDQNRNSTGIESQDSISAAVKDTSSVSSNMFNESQTSKAETTPEEIKEYVKQFKIEVDEKFKLSETNKKFKFPKVENYQSDQDSESSIQSLTNIEKYNLQSQNFRLNFMDEQKIKEPVILAEFLQQVGTMDKMSLETYLKNDSCSIYQVLMNCMRSKFEKEFEKQIEDAKKQSVTSTIQKLRRGLGSGSERNHSSKYDNLQNLHNLKNMDKFDWNSGSAIGYTDRSNITAKNQALNKASTRTLDHKKL